MRFLIIFGLSCAWVLHAQQHVSAVEKQRLSIRKQTHATGAQGGFFLTPWLDSKTADLPLAPAPSTVSVAAPSTVAPPGDCDPVSESALSKIIDEASQREHVDSRVVRAIVKRESASKPCAVSPKGAQGLMQLMPATAMELGVQDPFDAEANINAGVRYLKQMLDRYGGNVALALAAYNAGPHRVAQGGKIPDIPETQAYVMNILAQLNEEPATEVK